MAGCSACAKRRQARAAQASSNRARVSTPTRRAARPVSRIRPVSRVRR